MRNKHNTEAVMKSLVKKHINVSDHHVDISRAQDIGIKTGGKIDYMLKTTRLVLFGLNDYKKQFISKDSTSNTFGISSSMIPKDYMRKTKA